MIKFKKETTAPESLKNYKSDAVKTKTENNIPANSIITTIPVYATFETIFGQLKQQHKFIFKITGRHAVYMKMKF